MAAKYELTKTSDGGFRFNLKAANGQVVLTSQRYADKAGAMTGIESVKANAASDEHYQRKSSAGGDPFFTLLAPNQQVIGTSQMYASEDARDKGIESVKTNGPSAAVDDQA
jgi:uncharacterized protein YegP (UPF0339 family)